MAEEKKKRAITRLESSALARPLVNKMYMEGALAGMEERPVAWSMVNWWEGDIIMRAMGVTPVYPENFGTVCAALGMAQKYMGVSAAGGFPTHLCGYAQNTIGYTTEMKRDGKVPEGAPLGGMAQPTFMLCSEGYCDARFKWFQSLRQFWNVPVWTLPFPHPAYTDPNLQDVHKVNVEYMAVELQGFIAFLENLLKKKLDRDKLETMLNNQEKVFEVWWKINELRKAKPCPMHARDFWTMMVPCFYMAYDPETLAVYQQVYNEVKARVDNGIGAIPDEKYRLVFSELPPWHSLGFFDKLAERGWNFAAESTSYHPPPPMELNGGGDLLYRIARWTYWSYINTRYRAAKMGYPAVGAAQPYYNWGVEYKIDGILTHPLVTCRAATFGLTHSMNVLRDKLDIPGMSIQGDIVDLTVFDAATALNQAPAFEESMDHFRKVRKSKGLDW
ncbi:MAG: 2-hydroxyacyl-CoA dehydratase family protein [Proteobacteria bacterium]|nr:2-hydroxyacyl-CoA dehydratase family protein [Pseudomonadota bacterium]